MLVQPIKYITNDNAKIKMFALFKNSLFFNRIHIRVKFVINATMKSMTQ